MKIVEGVGEMIPHEEWDGPFFEAQPKTSPTLLALLERAKDHKMTPEEKRAQRKSWVIGEMMLEHPEMTREEAARVYDKISD